MTDAEISLDMYLFFSFNDHNNAQHEMVSPLLIYTWSSMHEYGNKSISRERIANRGDIFFIMVMSFKGFAAIHVGH